MFKKLSGVVLGAGILASQACAVESMDVSDVGSVDQAVLDCDFHPEIHQMQAALAVAMAKELKELNPKRDLQVYAYSGSQKKVVLSNNGNNRCNSMGGCPMTKAILDMQTATMPTGFNQFDPTAFRWGLVTDLEAQIAYENSLQMNNPSALPESHNLSFAGVEDRGGCGDHFVFDARKANCTPTSGTTTTTTGGSSSSCDGLRTWQGGNWQFTVQSGEVIQHNGRRYRANQYIGYPNAECAPGAAASWCAGWFTDLGACGSTTTTTTTTTTSGTNCNLADVSKIRHRLKAFGWSETGGHLNPYLDFQSSGSQIAIDPSYIPGGSGDTSSGSCPVAAIKIDPTFAINGTTCCNASGDTGTYQPHSAQRPQVFLCIIN